MAPVNRGRGGKKRAGINHEVREKITQNIFYLIFLGAKVSFWYFN